MRRYARFSDDYINESMENYDNLEAAAEELDEATQNFYDTCCDIIESYELSPEDLQEVSAISKSGILDEDYFWRYQKTRKGKKLPRHGGKFYGDPDSGEILTGADAWKQYLKVRVLKGRKKNKSAVVDSMV